MNATGLLFLLVGIFVLVNAGNIMQVMKGEASINIAKGSRTTTSSNKGGGGSF